MLALPLLLGLASQAAPRSASPPPPARDVKPAAPTAGPTQDEAEPSAALRLMSFNIRYGTAVDGNDAWLHRDHLVLDTIRRFDPDVLGVQEALAFQMSELQKALPDHLVVGEGREGGTKGEYSALFVRKGRFDVLEGGQFWLSEKPDEVASRSWDAALPRICTHARLRDTKSGGREFVVMNTHFDHRGAVARLRSAQLIAARMPARPMPCVVMGDLNAGESSDPLKALREAGLVDAYRTLHPDAKEAGTFNGFRGTRSGAKIDYVLTRGAWKVQSAAIDDHHEGERYPSDHFPVNAVLEWPEAAPEAGAGDGGGGASP